MTLNRMQRLEQRFQEHPYFIENKYRPGLLKSALRNFNTSMSELEAAVEIIVSNADDYYEPQGLLSRKRVNDWPFNAKGKCTLKDYSIERERQGKKDQRDQQAKEKRYWTGKVPDWDRAYRWFQSLPYEQSEKIREHIRIQLDWLRSPFQDILHAQSPGRYILVQCWRYATDVAYREFVDGYGARA